MCDRTILNNPPALEGIAMNQFSMTSGIYNISNLYLHESKSLGNCLRKNKMLLHYNHEPKLK